MELISNQLVKNVHDCSKGGLAIAISELCIQNNIGANVSLDEISSNKISDEAKLFSESHSRYVLVTNNKNKNKIVSILQQNNVFFKIVGEFGGDQIIFSEKKNSLAKLRVDKAQDLWFNSLEKLIHG